MSVCTTPDNKMMMTMVHENLAFAHAKLITVNTNLKNAISYNEQVKIITATNARNHNNAIMIARNNLILLQQSQSASATQLEQARAQFYNAEVAADDILSYNKNLTNDALANIRIMIAEQTLAVNNLVKAGYYANHIEDYMLHQN